MRNAGLDLLRFIAVALVMGRHMQGPDAGTLAFRFFEPWHTGGWIGVDLFFVLSGFLVSGLLFKEYKRSGQLDVKRFLIRRGFKIYPAFWVMLFVTIVVKLIKSEKLPPRSVAGEVFFFQNYLGGLWNHTWSLAVEEHFYFGLAAMFWFVMIKRGRKDFTWVPKLFGAVALFCLGARIASTIIWPKYSDYHHLFGTHLRADSLFYGVLLSYLYHFEPEKLVFTKWPSSILATLGIVLWLPAFVWNVDDYPLIHTIGLSLFYIGSGFLVVLALRMDRASNPASKLIAALGATSYSIYLWHMPVHRWGAKLLFDHGWGIYLVTYVIGACAIGYVLSRIIETPTLYARDRLFPSGA